MIFSTTVPLFKRELPENARFRYQFKLLRAQNQKKFPKTYIFRTSSPRPLFWQSLGKSVFSILHDLSQSLQQTALKYLTLSIFNVFFLHKESNPWWQVTLEKTLYVASVEIIDTMDCCPRDIGMITVTVSTSPTGLDPTCTQSMEYGRKTQDYKFICSPQLARGSYVIVTLIGDEVTLVLCQVVIKTIGKLLLIDTLQAILTISTTCTL